MLVVCGPACHRVFVQGGKARGWEGELEATERRLRDHLDMLVKSETLQGQTRDRARTQDRLQRRTSFVVDNTNARAFWDRHFLDAREVAIESLCEALTFDWERTSSGTDVGPAIAAVRRALREPTVTVLKFGGLFKSGTIEEFLQGLLDQANVQRASIPAEVPELPASLQPRHELLNAMKAKVLAASEAARSISLVGAKRRTTQSGATTSAHGMGGVGKTLMVMNSCPLFIRVMIAPREHAANKGGEEVEFFNVGEEFFNI